MVASFDKDLTGSTNFLEPAVKDSREDRRQTGRVVAVLVALCLILLAVYHAVVQRKAVLAGVIVPALIMLLYTAWVLYITKRDKRKRLLLATQSLRLAEVAIIKPVMNTTPQESYSQKPKNSTRHEKILKHQKKLQNAPKGSTTSNNASCHLPRSLSFS